jgi:hypothetical protein
VVQWSLKLPGEPDDSGAQFCQPTDREGVRRLLPDDETVLIVFFFHAHDLSVLPLRLDDSGLPRLLHPPEGHFRLPAVLPRLKELLKLQEGESLDGIDARLGQLRELLSVRGDDPDNVAQVVQVVRQVDMTPL